MNNNENITDKVKRLLLEGSLLLKEAELENAKLNRLLAEACNKIEYLITAYDSDEVFSEELQQWYEEHKKQ